MLASGELHAGFAGPAGLGNVVPRDRQSESYPDLLPDAAHLEAEWFRRTGIYPIHGVVVVKENLLKAHSWLAPALFAALTEAKDRYLRQLETGTANSVEDQRYRELSRIVGDPLPYGLEQNRPAINALVKYTHRQGLIPQAPSAELLFVDPRA
jgi:4,5-dihydroxyphthalate decarboxylase